MANRNFDQYNLTILKRCITLFANVAVPVGSTPVLQRWTYPTLGSGANARTYTAAPVAPAGAGISFPTRYQYGAEGVFSVVRTGTGLWTLQLQDAFQRILALKFGGGSLAGGASNIVAVAENTSITNMQTQLAANANAYASTLGIALLSATGAVADPTTGTTIRLELELQDATEP